MKSIFNSLQESEISKKFFLIALISLFLLRTVIGWHLLYEGIVKLYTPNWSAADYLSLSRWVFAPVFNWIAHSQFLGIVNMLNIFGLILAGAGLMLGLFSRTSGIIGAALLILYYISNPPLVGLDYGIPAEGDYLVVNKNLI